MKKVNMFVLNSFKNDTRVLKTAMSLDKFGFEVRIIAFFENGLKESENVHNIAVNRVKFFGNGWSKSKFIRLFQYLHFVLKTLKFKDADYIHANDIHTLPTAFLIKKLFKKDTKIIYDAHEYETETVNLRGIFKTLSKKIEKFLIKYAYRVITVSPSIAKDYAKLYAVKPYLVLNTPPFKQSKKHDIFREKFGISKDTDIFLYQGGLSRGRGIELIVEAFKGLNDSTKCVIFMGYGELSSLIKESAKISNNIYYHEAVSPEILLDYTSSADYGICLIEGICLSYTYSLPNKMFEYIMAGVGVVGSNLPEIKRVIETNKVGVVVSESSKDALIKACGEIAKLDKNALSQNLKNASKIYNWENQEQVLAEIYEVKAKA